MVTKAQGGKLPALAALAFVVRLALGSGLAEAPGGRTATPVTCLAWRRQSRRAFRPIPDAGTRR